MDMFALTPVQPDPAIVPIKTLELAPEGWRACVERVAEGFAEVIGDHAYCLNCGNTVHGAQGHNATCLTMVARRILVNEPYLHAQRNTSVSLRGVDIDAANKRWTSPHPHSDISAANDSASRVNRTLPDGRCCACRPMSTHQRVVMNATQ